jgi:hypothetical protein
METGILVTKLANVTASKSKYVHLMAVQTCTRISRVRIMYTEFKPDTTDEMKHIYDLIRNLYFSVYHTNY